MRVGKEKIRGEGGEVKNCFLRKNLTFSKNLLFSSLLLPAPSWITLLKLLLSIPQSSVFASGVAVADLGASYKRANSPKDWPARSVLVGTGEGGGGGGEEEEGGEAEGVGGRGGGGRGEGGRGEGGWEDESERREEEEEGEEEGGGGEEKEGGGREEGGGGGGEGGWGGGGRGGELEEGNSRRIEPWAMIKKVEPREPETNRGVG